MRAVSSSFSNSTSRLTRLGEVLGKRLLLFDEEAELEVEEVFGNRAILAGGFGLLGEGGELAFQFVDDIIDAQEVVADLVELAHGLVLALAIALNAGRLLEDLAAVFGADREEAVNFVLADDGIGVLADAGVEEEFVNITEAAGHAVDEELALAGAKDAAGDGDFGEVEGQHAVGVIEGDGDLAHARAAAAVGAGENDILGLLGAERFHALLAQTPDDRVGEVGLAAAVGADDGGDAGTELEAGPVGKGFEAVAL